jgi:hypothetical protein
MPYLLLYRRKDLPKIKTEVGTFFCFRGNGQLEKWKPYFYLRVLFLFSNLKILKILKDLKALIVGVNYYFFQIPEYLSSDIDTDLESLFSRASSYEERAKVRHERTRRENEGRGGRRQNVVRCWASVSMGDEGEEEFPSRCREERDLDWRGGGRREEGRGKREEGRGKREEGGKN